MLDCVMLVQNRPELTRQALESFIENTHGEWRMTIVDDHSSLATSSTLNFYQSERVQLIRNGMVTGPGNSRNRGIRASEQNWGRGDWLYLCDNDCYFKSDWDRMLIEAFVRAQEFNFRVLAGYVHPYNQTTASLLVDGYELHEKYAVGLLSWLMCWDTCDLYGPFDPAPAANGSEDWAFCHRVRLAGGRVGCVWPWVVVNCGLTGANGKLSPGSEMIFRQPDMPEGLVIL